MRILTALLSCFILFTVDADAQRPNPASTAAKYIYGKNSSTKVLEHVRLIDGTGGPILQDETIIIEGTKIARIGPNLAAPADAEVLDLSGYTVLPGLVGMHDHLYYLQRPNSDISGSEPPTLLPQMTFSAPRMYLANGVTTIRTGGSVEPILYRCFQSVHMFSSGSLIWCECS